MTGIVSSGTSSTDVRVGSEDIDKFAFTLVTPLGTESGGLALLQRFVGGEAYTTVTPSGVTDRQPRLVHHDDYGRLTFGHGFCQTNEETPERRRCVLTGPNGSGLT